MQANLGHGRDARRRPLRALHAGPRNTPNWDRESLRVGATRGVARCAPGVGRPL